MSDTICPCHLGKQLENIHISVYNPEENTIEEKMLLDRKHNWTILFFYPADFSVVCPTELAALNKHKEIFTGYNTKVYVISRDSSYTHKQWVETEEQLQDFHLEMISDRDGIFGKMFDIIDDNTRNYQRATIIVDKLGRIQSIEVLPVSIGRSIKELVRKIASLEHVLQHPETLCSEGWDSGKETLHDTIKTKKEPKRLFI